MKKLLLTKFTIFAAAAIVVLASCKSETRYITASSGRSGEVVVVINTDIWNSKTGEAVRQILTETDTLLPQPEAKFSLINIPHQQFTNLFKSNRNIVFVQIDKNKTECEISSKTDVYATPQTIVYIIGSDEDQIVEALQKRSNKVLEIFETAELERVKANAKAFEDADLRALVENKYGYSLYFPQDYELFGDKNEFMWIGLRTTKRTQGVLIYSYPYTNKEQLSLDSLIAKRDEILQQYVLLDKEPEGSAYMTTSNYLDPAYSTMKINDEFFVRVRGLWEIKNDFMGGPFVSYTTIDKAKNMVITFEGFVYSPSSTKRDLMRQLEGIVIAAKPMKSETSIVE